MTKNILLAAVALIALGAAPAFAETKTVAPNAVVKTSSVHKAKSKKIHQVKAVHSAKPSMHKAMNTSRSQGEREREITRELNKNGFQGV